MKTVCSQNLCNGCMACIEKCKSHAIFIEKEVEHYNAYIDEAKCIGCSACYNVCPRNHSDINFIHPIAWYQGWSNNSEVRSSTASGGVASEIMTAFIESGGYVCSCLFSHGEFVFMVSSDKNDIRRFAGSKYVKSNPEGIYETVQQLLKKQNKVLFLGLPCQVAAIRSYVNCFG